MTRPSVLVISHTYVVGLNRAKFQNLSDFAEVTLLVPHQWCDTLRIMPLDPLSRDARYHLLSAPIFYDGHAARYFFSPVQLWQIIRRVHPDLLHIEEEPIGLSFLQVALLKKIFADRAYRFSFFTWQNIFLKTTWLERFNLASADAAIAGNREAAAILRAKGYQRTIACIPQLGVDMLTTCATDSDHAIFRMGYAGRLVAEKGLLVLMDALSNLSGDWTLKLIGDGPLRATLKRIVRERGWLAKVQFMGAVPHAQVTEYLQQLDVLVLPSISTPAWKEQFGHVLIEAMARGVPVLGSDSGAIPEVIGDTGLIVPEKNSQALCAALDQLRCDHSLHESLSQRGRERVSSEYTHEQIARKTWDVWRQVLES